MIRGCEDGRYLNDIVPEINSLSFFFGSILNIENANEVGCPTTQQAIEELKKYPRKHPKLRKCVWQCQQNLSHLI